MDMTTLTQQDEDAEKRGQEVQDAKEDQRKHAAEHREGKFKEELTSDSEDAVGVTFRLSTPGSAAAVESVLDSGLARLRS